MKRDQPGIPDQTIAMRHEIGMLEDCLEPFHGIPHRSDAAINRSVSSRSGCALVRESGRDSSRDQATRRVFQARVPVNGALPNMPSLALPEIVSPATLAVNSRVIDIGWEISAFQAAESPSTVPSRSVVEPIAPDNIVP